MLNRRIYDFFNSLPVSSGGREETVNKPSVNRYVPWLFITLSAIAAFLWAVCGLSASANTDDDE